MFVAEESLIMVCTSCGSIEVVASQGEDDAWAEITSTVRRHQSQNRACHGAQHWFGSNLEDCPYPVASPEGPVN